MAKNNTTQKPLENETEEQKAARLAAEEEEKKKEAEEKEKKKEKTVSIPEKTLQSILDRIDSLEESNKQKDEKIEMLTDISDKARLARYEEKNKGQLVRTAKLALWEDRPIVGWTKGKDEVGYREGRLIVNQTVKMFLETPEGKDPEIKEVDYLYWAQNVKTQTGEIVGRNETNEGTFVTLLTKDGRKITLDIRFINAF